MAQALVTCGDIDRDFSIHDDAGRQAIRDGESVVDLYQIVNHLRRTGVVMALTWDHQVSLFLH